MTKKTPLNRAGVAMAIGLSGCGVERAATTTAESSALPVVIERPAATSTNRASLTKSVDESLERLRALELFTVNRLVMKLPANARDCYGVPCPGDEAGQAAYDAELTRQAKRLAAFAEQAQQCNSGNCYLFGPETGKEALDALNALEIVEVGALVAAQPKNSTACYNLPCPADREAAAAETRRREVIAFTIATYAKDL